MWRVTVLYTYNLKYYCIWPLLSICAQQVLVSRVNTALHVHGCTAVHSCHLKYCYWQSLVIVNIRARTAESTQMSRKCTYNFKTFALLSSVAVRNIRNSFASSYPFRLSSTYDSDVVYTLHSATYVILVCATASNALTAVAFVLRSGEPIVTQRC